MNFQKRISVALFIATIFNLNLSAQEVSKPDNGAYADKTFFYEQGLNCTQFVKQYLSLNATSNTNVPYLFTGNFVYKNIGMRYGLNFTNGRTSTSEDPTNSNSSSTNKNTFKELKNIYDARVGAFYYKRLSKRFITNVGADFLYTNSYIKSTTRRSSSSGMNFTSTVDADTKNTSVSVGFGPFISIQYSIAPRISIGTESSVYYIMTDAKQSGSTTNTFSSTFNNGQSIVTQTTTEVTTNNNSAKVSGSKLNVPLSLFVYFRF